jgi:hypothetical protein
MKARSMTQSDMVRPIFIGRWTPKTTRHSSRPPGAPHVAVDGAPPRSAAWRVIQPTSGSMRTGTPRRRPQPLRKPRDREGRNASSLCAHLGLMRWVWPQVFYTKIAIRICKRLASQRIGGIYIAGDAVLRYLARHISICRLECAGQMADADLTVGSMLRTRSICHEEECARNSSRDLGFCRHDRSPLDRCNHRGDHF